MRRCQLDRLVAGCLHDSVNRTRWPKTGHNGINDDAMVVATKLVKKLKPSYRELLECNVSRRQAFLQFAYYPDSDTVIRDILVTKTNDDE